MFILYGTRTRTTQVGRRPFVCPICCGLTIASVSALSTQRHIYFIPTSRRQYFANELRCESCDLLTARPWTPDYWASTDKHADAEALFKHAPPSVQHDIVNEGAEIPVSSEVADSAPSEQALETLRAFSSLEYAIARRAETLHVDRWSGLALVTLFIGSFSLLIFGARKPNPHSTERVFFIFTISFAILVAILLGTDTLRFFRRRLLPFVGRALANIQPTLEDITWAKNQLARHQFVISRYIKPERLASFVAAHHEGASS